MEREYDKMTVSEAQKLLASGLRFGDTKQIHAVQLIELATDLRQHKSELEIECSTCGGLGTHECECGHSHSCEDCSGTGYTDDSVTDSRIDRMGIIEIKCYLSQLKKATHA
jgi:hypothetical protein